jgi:hypothetical protein
MFEIMFETWFGFICLALASLLAFMFGYFLGRDQTEECIAKEHRIAIESETANLDFLGLQKTIISLNNRAEKLRLEYEKDLKWYEDYCAQKEDKIMELEATIEAGKDKVFKEIADNMAEAFVEFFRYRNYYG